MTCDVYPCVVAAPLAGLAAYCLAQVAGSRLVQGRRPYVTLFAGFGVGMVAVIAVSAVALHFSELSASDSLGLLLLNLMAYGALGFGYFNFVNMNITSLRIRMLQELLARGGRMSREELLSCYGTDEMIDLRISRLVRGGHLVESGGRLQIGKRSFLLLARVFALLRWIVLGRAARERNQAHEGE